MKNPTSKILIKFEQKPKKPKTVEQVAMRSTGLAAELDPQEDSELFSTLE